MKRTSEKLKIRQRRANVVLKELKKLSPKAGMMLRYSNHWELLVAVELSAQCTDKKVNEVTQRLFKKYRTLDDYIHAKQKDFEKDIYSTGFYCNKAKNILAAAKMIKKEYGGEVPYTMKEILKVPGVARKTANVVLGNAYGIVEGIAVDTHVRRLSRLFGLTKEHDPNKIEQDLMEILPKKEWFRFTYRVIEYGRTYCKATPRHDHKECPVTKVLIKKKLI